MLVQLCGTFLNELPFRVGALRAALKERNDQRAGRALQKLRDCLMAFGPGPVSMRAGILEAAIRAGRIRKAQREWQCLEQQLEILLPQVQRLMLEMASPRSAVQ